MKEVVNRERRKWEQGGKEVGIGRVGDGTRREGGRNREGRRWE